MKKNLEALFTSFLVKVFLLESFLVVVFSLLANQYFEINKYKKLLLTDDDFLNSVAIAQIRNNEMTRDMLLYEYVEENSLSSITFLKKISDVNRCQKDGMSYYCEDKDGSYQLYQPLIFDSNLLGYFKIVGTTDQNNHKLIIIISLLAFLVNLIFSMAGITFFIRRPLQENLKSLISSINGVKISKISSNPILEFKQLESSFLSLLNKLKVSETKRVSYEVKQEKHRNNRQIAHDIRSPLEALKSITGNLDHLDFSTKQIISNSVGRISDIANGLLKSGQGEQKEFIEGNLRILLDDIIADKQFEHDHQISYQANIAYKNSYISGNESKLYRAISNLINNAIEASENKAEVQVVLSGVDDSIQLEIIDQGAGISEDLLQKVLEGGVTTKEKGNGLGLSYAKKAIEEHKGTLEITSVAGKGTRVIIILPKIETPMWFTDTIEIKDDVSQVVCVDDDLSFLQLYKDKLGKFNVYTFTEKQIERVLNFDKAQYFFDYDLGKEKTGLDFIIENNLASKSTLVTSMHQDKEIQKRCMDHGIKILPKQIFNNAQVVVLDVSPAPENATSKFHILIDDDTLMHLSWQMEADKQGVNFKAFKLVAEFLKNADQFAKDSVIYVDSNLGDGLKGEIESEKIAKLGFENIYLATGYAASDIERPAWIKEVVGKRARFLAS